MIEKKLSENDFKTSDIKRKYFIMSEMCQA